MFVARGGGDPLGFIYASVPRVVGIIKQGDLAPVMADVVPLSSALLTLLSTHHGLRLWA